LDRAPVLRSQSDNRSRQRVFISSDDRRVSLRSAWLANDGLVSLLGQMTVFSVIYLSSQDVPFRYFMDAI
jgi:hypothetical protein